ncbi:MAG: CopD family protein [Thermodesulfobacteriota bacterium]
MKNFFIFSFILILFLPSSIRATPEYAEQTGFECQKCHFEAIGGKLTEDGTAFKEALKVKGLYRPLKPFQKIVRLIIGYIHLITAIAWFGTILYVHLLLKPAYAAKGLPKGELILGWTGIALLSLTGFFLTLARIPNWSTFYTTRFGILLSLKIILFAIMVGSAAIVTFILGPKIRRQAPHHLPQDKKRLSLNELSYFDGKEGRPAYFAYKGKVYEATSSALWKGGNHMKKHSAGKDLTDLLSIAPHGEDKVFKMPLIGELIPIKESIPKRLSEKAFYFMAYMNLVFVFLITFVIALWRWGESFF